MERAAQSKSRLRETRVRRTDARTRLAARTRARAHARTHACARKLVAWQVFQGAMARQAVQLRSTGSWLRWLVVALSILLLSAPIDGKGKKGDITELFAALSSEDANEARDAAHTLSQRSPLLGVHAEEAHRRTQVLINTVAGKGDASEDVGNAVNELAAYMKKLVRAN